MENKNVKPYYVNKFEINILSLFKYIFKSGIYDYIENIVKSFFWNSI